MRQIKQWWRESGRPLTLKHWARGWAPLNAGVRQWMRNKGMGV